VRPWTVLFGFTLNRPLPSGRFGEAVRRKPRFVGFYCRLSQAVAILQTDTYPCMSLLDVNVLSHPLIQFQNI